MHQDRLINKLPTPHRTLEIMWAEKTVRKPLELSGYEHTKACGDIFIALSATGELQAWGLADRKDRKIIEDRRFKLLGSETIFYLEEDLGTEGIEKIASKVERYVKREGRFHVIFDVPNESRADKILTLLGDYRRGNQFIVTIHEYMARHPLAGIFVSPKQPENYLSLLDLHE